MKINNTNNSHDDHLSASDLALTLSLVSEESTVVDFGTFAIHVVRLPHAVACGLRGPLVGDEPISEENVFYGIRGEGKNKRPNPSRLTDLPMTQDDRVTVLIGREDAESDWNLITAYGGPLAPQEPSDPFLPAEKHEDSARFWKRHALSGDAGTFERAEDQTFETFAAPAPPKGE